MNGKSILATINDHVVHLITHSRRFRYELEHQEINYTRNREQELKVVDSERKCIENLLPRKMLVNNEKYSPNPWPSFSLHEFSGRQRPENGGDSDARMPIH